MVHTPVLLVQYCRDPPVAITTTVMMVYLADFTLYLCVFIRPVADRLMIIPGAAGHPGGGQQIGQGMLCPQRMDDFCFFLC